MVLILIPPCCAPAGLISSVMMDTEMVLARIKGTESPLKRQLLTAALITGHLREMGKGPPVVIDRLNACKHWRSETDCEMVALLLARYSADLDWDYLEKKATEPANDTAAELKAMKAKGR